MISLMTRRGKIAAAASAISLGAAGVLAGSAARAQQLPPGQIGSTRVSAPINVAKDISFTQKLDNQVSLETPFRDEDGRVAPLKSYFGKRPVILVMPFYKCPGVCTTEMNSMVDTFRDEKMKYKVGREFDVVTISINPREGADLATAKKREYLDLLNQPGAEAGWHFLTGEEQNIRRVADQIGFKYVYDAKTDQYAHPSGIVLLTPEGKVSKYFFGVAYPARDVKLALTEAGQGRVGSAVDQFLLACYHYDPKTGTYGPKVFLIMQVVGSLTILLLGSFMVMAFRISSREPRLVRTADGRIVPDTEAETEAPSDRRAE